MSSGHRLAHKLTASEISDLAGEALADKNVKLFLSRPFRVVTSFDIPLLGSSSIGWRKVYIDRHFPFLALPVGDRKLNVRKGLLTHERLEVAFENCLGWTYPIAHAVAQSQEDAIYAQMGFDPKEVEAAYAPFIRDDEREPLIRVPTDLDMRPLLADKKLLARTRAAQEDGKLSQASVSYVEKSQKPNKQCGSCSMFVEEIYGGPACTLVKSPINAGGYCRRFLRGQLDNG